MLKHKSLAKNAVLCLVVLIAPVIVSTAVVNAAPATQTECEAAGGTWKWAGVASNGVKYGEYCEGGRQNSGSSSTDGEQVSRESCLLNGGQWTAGRCHTYEAQTTNDCQELRVDANNCGIMRYLKIFINVLSALAGVVIVGSIVGGGIQYSMAGSDPQKVQAAKARIRNAIIALLFFLFGYGLLNYLVPGGVL